MLSGVVIDKREVRRVALLAETLVEEWLNRQGYFTVRGVKEGVREMDLLAVRHSSSSDPEGLHVEVQASFRPNNYVARLARQHAKDRGVGRTAAIARTPEMVREAAQEWGHDKFLHPVKFSRREAFWPGLSWGYVLVHAVVKDPPGLGEFRREGIRLIYLKRVLEALCRGSSTLKPAVKQSLEGIIPTQTSY